MLPRGAAAANSCDALEDASMSRMGFNASGATALRGIHAGSGGPDGPITPEDEELFREVIEIVACAEHTRR